MTSHTCSLMHVPNTAYSQPLEYQVYDWLLNGIRLCLVFFSIRSPPNFEGFFVMCYKNARALSREPPCRNVDLAGKSKKHNESKKINYQTYKKYIYFIFFFLPLKSALFVFTFEKVIYISSACRKQTNKHTTMHKTTPNVKASASKSSLDIWILSLYSVCSISNKTLYFHVFHVLAS